MKLPKLFNLKKRHPRESRPNAFVLESLEPRLLLSATPMTAAVVTTDHLDYAPGETAVITTSNQNGEGPQFAAGELVRFQVSRTDGMADAAGSTADVGPAGSEAWYVADGVGGFTAHQQFDAMGQAIDRDGNGIADWIAPDNDLTVNSSISTTWYVEEQYRNSSLLVTAAGQESGAVDSQAFTDAAINTTTTVTSSSATSFYGTAVIFTATVTPASGTGRPAGSVQFFDGATPIGFAIFDTPGAGLTSTFSITYPEWPFDPLLKAGSHSIRAVFTGTVDIFTGNSFNDSTSSPITHTVMKADTVISLAADPATFTYGGWVFLEATVVNVPGTADPTGIVGFYDGATLLGTTSLGVAIPEGIILSNHLIWSACRFACHPRPLLRRRSRQLQ